MYPPPNLFPAKMPQGPAVTGGQLRQPEYQPAGFVQQAAVPSAAQFNGYPEQQNASDVPLQPSAAGWAFSQASVGFLPTGVHPPVPPVQNTPASQAALPALQRNQLPPLIRSGLPPSLQQDVHKDMHDSLLPKASEQLIPDMSNLNINTRGSVDLIKQRHILPSTPIEAPSVTLPPPYDRLDVRTYAGVMRCTLTTVPSNKSTLKNARLPLGLIIHPYQDLKKLTVISARVIVRCRTCRVYINPYVTFPDQQHWRCNLCGRSNPLPEDFYYDPVKGAFGDPTKRPEVRNASVEFVAPSEYMSRVPPPACYVFIMDVSKAAMQSGYLTVLCDTLADKLNNMPGDEDSLITFIAVDSSLHFFKLNASGRPKHLVITETDDDVLPCARDVVANLHSLQNEIRDLLAMLPQLFANTEDDHCAMGSALSAASKLVRSDGGRISVFLATLPTVGKGALKNREDPNLRASTDVQHMTSATDFYKRLALECSASQIGVDLFVLADKYVDIATLADVAKFTGGTVMYYPAFNVCNNTVELIRLAGDLERYLLRKIGFEAVLRVRCTTGYAVHHFFGNHFIRSTDLLVLANINPDSALAVQLDIEENVESRVACFQAALLYSNSDGERRIRVHTICLPTTESVAEVHHGADAQSIVSLLARMASDRCTTGGSLIEAREALMNAVIDALHAYNACLSSRQYGTMLCSWNLRTLPLYVLGLLKHTAFAHGTSIKLDHRMAAMCNMRIWPLSYLIRSIYPDFYPLLGLTEQNQTAPLLSLSFEMVDRNGVYLMDTGHVLLLYIGPDLSQPLIQEIFGVDNYDAIWAGVGNLPQLESNRNVAIRKFIDNLRGNRPFALPLRIIKDGSPFKELFTSRMVEDRSESSMSYTELLHLLQAELRPR